MEPLTGFFILEGLFFDVIGVIIIIYGLTIFPIIRDSLYKINTEKLKGLANMNFILNNVESNPVNKVDLKYLNRIKYQKNMRAPIKPEMIYTITNTQLQKVNQYVSTMQDVTEKTFLQYQIISNYEQHKTTFYYGIKGLPFLVGGFILQGIGVVNQLLNP